MVEKSSPNFPQKLAIAVFTLKKDGFQNGQKRPWIFGLLFSEEFDTVAFEK